MSDISLYLKAVGPKAWGSSLICNYCGVDTQSYGPTGFCSNCESMTAGSRASLTNRDAELLQALNSINGYLGAADFANAAKMYDQLSAKYKDPGFTYASGILHIKWSNAAVSKLDYNLPGYMEQNAQYVDLSNSLISKSKSMFYNVIELYKLDQAHQDAPNYVHTVFLCHLKLGDHRQAERSAKRLSELKVQDAADYSALALGASLGKYDEVLKATSSMAASGRLGVNAAFYAAMAMFNKRKNREAMAIAKAIYPYLPKSRIDSFIRNVQRIESAALL